MSSRSGRRRRAREAEGAAAGPGRGGAPETCAADEPLPQPRRVAIRRQRSCVVRSYA